MLLCLKTWITIVVIQFIIKTRLGVDKVKPKGWFKYF